MGYIENPFIICDGPNNLYSNKIEFFEQDEKNLILQLSAQEYQNFFDEGQLGTKYLYQAKTKLTRASLILSLQQYVKQGEINIDKLNSGEEVIAVVSAGKSPFEAGETLHLGMATDDSGSGCGISRIDHADVKIGAVVMIPPSVDTVTGRALKSDFGDNSGAEPPYNLLTTATGAGNMGMSCASYTKIYCMGDMDGGLIPANSGMSVTYLDDMKRDNFLTRASKLGGSVLVLTVMLMLGFAAYFNGIGIKIRLKAYDISVLRALGTPIKKIKNKLLLACMKIPIAASAISFVLLSACRALTEYVSHIPDLRLQMTSTEEVYTLQQIPWRTAAEVFFWYNRWWRADPILPTLAVLLIIGSISLLLTHRAFKKFNSDISASLNEGRTRQ